MARATPADRRVFEERRELLEVEAHMNGGDIDRAAEGLTRVLAERRVRGDLVFLPSRPDLAARIANLALERDIEPAYVRSLIERHTLIAPEDASPHWPFALRIRVLGAFELIRHGQPMRFTGKTQQRPLDVLKYVVAAGGSVDLERITGALWPEADGAAAKHSFDSALFRLRKLIDIENAIDLSAGQLAISRTLVRTDLDAFEAALANAGNAGADPLIAARRLLAAYPGPLLGSEENPWIVAPREALRARFIRAVMDLGTALEKGGEWTMAIDMYRSGLEVDNLAESMYRRLMRALAATGNHAEALLAFRRCRELLSIVLGLKPSEETERLHRDIVSHAGNSKTL